MRTNLEDSQTYRVRHFATKMPCVSMVFSGLFQLPLNGPDVYMLDPGASTGQVKMPPLTEEFAVVIAHIGSLGSIDIYDANNVLLTGLVAGDVRYFFAGKAKWVWLGSNVGASDLSGMSQATRIVTVPGTQVISSAESGIVLNKSVVSITPITLPPAAARSGRPIRIVDWAGNVSVAFPVVLTPNGAEKINNRSSWTISNLSSGGVMLFPHIGLNGYTVGA